jgi:hypothetical protein
MKGMHMGRVFLATLFITAACILSFAMQDQGPVARKAIDSWLALVDGGDYPASWDTAATGFKKAITRERWQAALEAVRTPLGKTKSRTLKSTTATRTLPGAPDGEYFVFQFDASFEQKQSAVETVTAVHDADASWRVAGYFIK